MRKLIVGSVLCAAVASACAQIPITQDIDNKMQALPALRVSVGSTPLQCERELDAAMVGKTEAEAEALFASAARQVRLQQPVQLTVKFGSTNVTSDARTQYVPTNCMIATKFGLVTPVQTDTLGHVDPTCVPGTLADVWVVVSSATTTQAWNRCFFKITK